MCPETEQQSLHAVNPEKASGIIMMELSNRLPLLSSSWLILMIKVFVNGKKTKRLSYIHADIYTHLHDLYNLQQQSSFFVFFFKIKLLFTE